MKTSRSPMPLVDYGRAFRVIHSVLENVDANTPRACLFFAIAGASILNEFYGREAAPVAGAAFYCVEEKTKTVLSFASAEPAEGLSSKTGFHCWVRCDGYVVDFMAPIFRESLSAAGLQTNVPRKMFQKPITSMCELPEELIHDGDFFLAPDHDLTRSLISGFVQKPASSDLVKLCLHWFKRPPAKISPTIQVFNEHREVTTMRLGQLQIPASW